MSQSAFKYFGIDKKSIPHSNQVDCEYILEKAKRIIVHRHRNEITSAIKAIYRFYQDSEHYFVSDEITDDKKIIYSPASVFQNLIDKFDLTTIPNFPSATWPECFALLSVTLIKNIFYRPLFWQDETLDEAEKKTKQHEFTSQLITEAMEAITQAEHLLEKQHDKEKKSNDSIRALEIRHNPGKELKCEFVAFFQENGAEYNNNQSEAARKFYRRLTKDKKIYTSLENAVRTLTKGLRAHRKGKLNCSNKK